MLVKQLFENNTNTTTLSIENDKVEAFKQAVSSIVSKPSIKVDASDFRSKVTVQSPSPFDPDKLDDLLKQL